MRRRTRVLSRLRRKYEITTERVKIGNLDLEFVRIADPDRVLDQVAEEEDRRERASGKRCDGDELHLPYWAELWDSSLGMAAFLADGPGRQMIGAGRRVLDLGCGMGLAGTAAAALGAEVLFADLEPPALLFAALNSLAWRTRVRTRRTNWRNDALGERFDVILGADILYERGQWEPLEQFWRRHLQSGGAVLLGEPGRQTGDMFPPWIASRGWMLERFDQPGTGKRKAIRLFRLSLAPTTSGK